MGVFLAAVRAWEVPEVVKEENVAQEDVALGAHGRSISNKACCGQRQLIF